MRGAAAGPGVDAGDGQRRGARGGGDGERAGRVRGGGCGERGRGGSGSARQPPLERTGELLEVVPGLIVTQHSGDGKANQYFLRGFDLDHGTDFATSVDGVPVNLPTHAHGQGYTDLNFLIPELVEGLSYRKGPYYADAGDFAAAGAADIRLKTHLDSGLLSVSAGEYGYRRCATRAHRSRTSTSIPPSRGRCAPAWSGAFRA